MKQKKYYPKGSMCMNCHHLDDNCSRKAFSDMPVVQRKKDILVVKCMDFKRSIKEFCLEKKAKKIFKIASQFFHQKNSASNYLGELALIEKEKNNSFVAVAYIWDCNFNDYSKIRNVFKGGGASNVSIQMTIDEEWNRIKDGVDQADGSRQIYIYFTLE